jgi:fused signal recognition particle receptor
MNPYAAFLAETLARAGESNGEDSGSDIVLIILLGLVVLFFAWLVIAAIRKKLSTSKGRIGEVQEDEQEAARTARLWAEAKRKAEEEEDQEEEDDDDEESVDIQAELLEKARERRESRPTTEQPPPEERFPDQSVEPVVREPDEPVPVPEQEQVEEAAPVEEPPPEPEHRPEPEAPPPERTLEDGLKKTRSGFVSRLSKMFGKGSIDEDDIEEIEEILFTADIGVRTSQKLLEVLQNETNRKERSDPEKLLGVLKDKIQTMLTIDSAPLETAAARPFVFLVVGVNGTGKTTTIGKLAMKYAREGKKVILAAADTFRAAAKEQLQIWGKRAGAQVISGQEGGDPGSVVFDAISAAKSQGADVVIADTAGRLHTKVNLIEELRKVHRVCGKALEGAPHEVLLVLDATTGQNAINQAKQFHKALEVTGVVLTKLDGTAKGGIIIGVCDTFGIPVRFIGIGEQVNDLRLFDPAPFVKALFT